MQRRLAPPARLDGIKRLTDQHAELSSRLAAESSQLEVVQASLRQNMETINANVKSLEDRISKLG